MKMSRYFNLYLIVVVVGCLASCSSPNETTVIPMDDGSNQMMDNEKVEGVDYFLPKIDLQNWKVTLPVGDPTEVEPPEILEYATNSLVKPFMYNDSTDGSLVFHTYPGATTQNTSYSRTELREQLIPGNNSVNWRFDDGGVMKGSLKLDDISIKSSGDPDRTIIMQIHSKLTEEQKVLLGASDLNGPPLVKVYWNDGRIKVHRKVLKDVDVDDVQILSTDAWGNDSEWLGEPVGNERFTLKITASEDLLVVDLNEGEATLRYDDIHVQKYGVFYNYFKAGNYLQTTDKDAFSTVKYYTLEVSH